MLSNIGFGGLAVIAVVIIVLFGRGRIAPLFGEFGSGISSFRSAVRGECGEADASPECKRLRDSDA
ncbi:twin-arginine translocase TatA/TatE family subunit [Amaricoccus sp. W119]|uniref:Sec-independent protein translocase subunit TatA/TatB n=1 Tax=Amaricoccus sp. W119 TaxID=3391833 RepID=UPI0039A4615D